MENNYNNIRIDKYDDEHMTVGKWIGTFLLMLIPIVNIVLMFVWAFGSNVNRSKKTYFQAQLIMCGIILALYLVVVILIIGAFS